MRYFPHTPIHPLILLVINSDIEKFVTWGNDLWGRTIHGLIPFDDVYELDWDFPKAVRYKEKHSCYIYVTGRIYEGGKPRAEPDEDDWRIVTIALVEVGENRLQVDIFCEFQHMLWFVGQTLWGMAIAWPEAKSQLDPLIDWFRRYQEDETITLVLKEDNKEKQKKRRGANQDTIEKIQKLANIRQEAIDNNRGIPAWSVACDMAGITRTTASKQAPQLRERWYDKAYRWTG